jgi:hypothetical protein
MNLDTKTTKTETTETKTTKTETTETKTTKTETTETKTYPVPKTDTKTDVTNTVLEQEIGGCSISGVVSCADYLLSSEKYKVSR